MSSAKVSSSPHLSISFKLAVLEPRVLVYPIIALFEALLFCFNCFDVYLLAARWIFWFCSWIIGDRLDLRGPGTTVSFLIATAIDLMLLLFFSRVFFMICMDLDYIVNVGCLGFVKFC